MLKRLKLKNFRNFVDSEFFFSTDKNAIIWDNWKWKTNILEAIAILNWTNVSKIDFNNLVNRNSDVFFIEAESSSWDIFSISYDKNTNKKKYNINNKNSNKKSLSQISNKVVSFSPIIMNMMYLSPSLRRDFLDEVLSKTFENYKILMSDYKKILITRNKILKNIRNKKSTTSELVFWDNKFILKATKIYNYRFWITDFLKENTNDFTNYFQNKINKFDFNYCSKIENLKWDYTKNEKTEYIKNQIQNTLENNLEKDIILWTTNVWPHIDDFEIVIDDIQLTEFASRGEVKSVIIWLKLLEIKFIENYINKKPILLIDDLLSELDNNHKEILIDNIKNYQLFITSIINNYKKNTNIIEL